MPTLSCLRYGVFIGDRSCPTQVAVKDDAAEAVETARAQLLYRADSATDACVLEAASKDDCRLLFWCRLDETGLHDLYQADARPQAAAKKPRRRTRR